MEFLQLIIGFIIGTFLWANIFGSLFATLPLSLRFKRQGLVDSVGWRYILTPLILYSIVILVIAFFWKMVFFGSLAGGVIMLFSIGKLRREAAENIMSRLAEGD